MRTIKQQKPKNTLAAIINLLTYLGALAFLLLGLSGIDNYQHPVLFSFALISAGGVLGCFLYQLLGKIIPDLKVHKNQKGRGALPAILFFTSMLAFGAGSRINKSLAVRSDCKGYVVLKKGESGLQRTKQHYLFIDNNGTRERLSFGKSFSESISQGDTINLCLVTGILGFNYKIPASR